MFRYWRLALLSVTAIASLALATPAMAYTELGRTGTVGTHSLTDTSSNAGTICYYTYRSSDNLWQLKHIYVNPPNIKAVPGMGMEKVAWSFTVQRRVAGFSGWGPWGNRYTSPKFGATTDSSHNASLSQEDVKVTVPFAPGSDAVAAYRVKVKLFWYKADGAHILGTATERDDWYFAYEDLDTVTRHHQCSDYEV